MVEAANPLPTRAIRQALARDAYERDQVRVVDSNLSGYQWLVASTRGVFAVSRERVKLVIHGWFFGIHRQNDKLFLFENCGHRDRTIPMGRIIRMGVADTRLVAPVVLAKGLHNKCHQLALIDGLVCVLDTANQAIWRFTPDGRIVDVKRPFPPAHVSDTTGAYLHFNAVAKIGDRIALMLHNGKAEPEKFSELAWLDQDWGLLERQPLPGHSCHDIVEDESGALWHTASMSGEIISSDGARVKVTDKLMTRGVAITRDAIIVGISTFGPRQVRDQLRGGVVIFDRAFKERTDLVLAGPPTDIVAL